MIGWQQMQKGALQTHTVERTTQGRELLLRLPWGARAQGQVAPNNGTDSRETSACRG
jgi:hypothetical protein